MIFKKRINLYILIVLILVIYLWFVIDWVLCNINHNHSTPSSDVIGMDANSVGSVTEVNSELTLSIERFIVTAFCPCELCCGEYADGITASGHIIQKGDKFVAAPNDFPFGTKIEIPGYGNVPVLDRGGAITKGRLDIYFESHADALAWGVKEFDFEVYREM